MLLVLGWYRRRRCRIARRWRGEGTFVRFYFHQPYVFGLIVATALAAIIPGDWMIKLLALVTALALTLLAAYVNFRLLIRRDRDTARSVGANADSDRS